jgi:hypothetical protein
MDFFSSSPFRRASGHPSGHGGAGAPPPPHPAPSHVAPTPLGTETSLACNRCFQPARAAAWITSCSHLLCEECGDAGMSSVPLDQRVGRLQAHASKNEPHGIAHPRSPHPFLSLTRQLHSLCFVVNIVGRSLIVHAHCSSCPPLAHCLGTLTSASTTVHHIHHRPLAHCLGTLTSASTTMHHIHHRPLAHCLGTLSASTTMHHIHHRPLAHCLGTLTSASTTVHHIHHRPPSTLPRMLVQVCTVCQQALPHRLDLQKQRLNPPELFKTMILAGLTPGDAHPPPPHLLVFHNHPPTHWSSSTTTHPSSSPKPPTHRPHIMHRHHTLSQARTLQHHSRIPDLFKTTKFYKN